MTVTIAVAIYTALLPFALFLISISRWNLSENQSILHDVVDLLLALVFPISIWFFIKRK
jgi:hypothetical protein